MTRQLQPGEHYGPYRVLEVLGCGGFAWVYRVEAPGRAEPAALKLSLQPVLDEASARRALREISVLRSLTNTHVVRIHAAGQDEEGHVFLLMDELEGAQLDVWHDFDQPMPPGQALWAVHQACLGLAEAHARGIVHRDIKPENLWVEPDQNVKVIDFGLARAWDAASTVGTGVTISGMLVGTPRYIQPEQIEGRRLTPASDVYSLTTILYELLSGHSVYFADRPFSEVREAYRDEPLPFIAGHAREQVVPLERYSVGATLPKALLELVYRGLDKEPLERFADARELANAIGEVLHYDLGAVLGATLRIVHPYGGHEDLLLLPGSHRIGRGSHCEVALQSDALEEEQAVLEWAGVPELPELHPLHDDGKVKVEGEIVRKRLLVPRDASVQIEGYTLSMIYPEG